MLDLRLTGARSEELSRGCSAPRLLRDVLEVVERRSFELEVVGGLATLPPSCSTALGHDSMRLMRLLIATRSSASMCSRLRRWLATRASAPGPLSFPPRAATKTRAGETHTTAFELQRLRLRGERTNERTNENLVDADTKGGYFEGGYEGGSFGDDWAGA